MGRSSGVAMNSFVGIDVSKEHLDVHVIPSNQSRRFVYEDPELNDLVQWLVQLQPQTIVVEASGGYEQRLVAVLLSRQLPISVINPQRARHFAKATGQLAKTDAIDAAVLAHFGQVLQPKTEHLSDEATEEFKALLDRRKQVVDMIVAEKNRLALARKGVRGDILKHISWLEKRLSDLDADLNQGIQSSPTWKAKDKMLQSVPGIGRIGSFYILTHLPELGLFDRRQMAALVGVAPIACDSGRFRGKRSIQGGRSSVRSALYMCTLVATRHNPVIRDFYKKLLLAGKPKMLALVACMRKLLTIINAMLKNNRPWSLANAKTA
jgi:transposase